MEAPNERRTIAIEQLRRLGVSERKIRQLIDSYPLERIERQLRWLPKRSFWKASAFIVSAVLQDYDPPAALYEEAALNSDITATDSSNSPSRNETEAA